MTASDLPPLLESVQRAIVNFGNTSEVVGERARAGAHVRIEPYQARKDQRETELNTAIRAALAAERLTAVEAFVFECCGVLGITGDDADDAQNHPRHNFLPMLADLRNRTITTSAALVAERARCVRLCRQHGDTIPLAHEDSYDEGYRDSGYFLAALLNTNTQEYPRDPSTGKQYPSLRCE